MTVSGDLQLLAGQLTRHSTMPISISLRCGHSHDLLLLNLGILSDQLHDLGAIIDHKSCKARVRPPRRNGHLVFEHVRLVLRHS